MRRNLSQLTAPYCFLLMLFFIPAYCQKSLAEESDFARSTIDLGIVVKDIEKSAKFYTETLGFTELDGFSVPGEFCEKAGLTAGHKLDIRVFALNEEDQATKIKLMQLPGVESKKGDNKTIHAQLGFSYLTIFVTDTNAALKRLEKAKVSLKSKGAVALPKGFPEGIFLALVADPDGNLIELVGPKKIKAAGPGN